MPTNEIEVGWRTQTSSETRPWAFDLGPEMDALDVPASATSVLTDLLTGLSFPTGLSGSPITATTSPHVTQNITGLTAGKNYRLVITVAMGGSKQTATVLFLRCPY